MADDASSAAQASALDPNAPAFAMPAGETANTSAGAQATANGQVQEPGPKQKQKPKRPAPVTGTTEADIAEAGAGVKLTGAELKKKKKAESAARRAEKVAERGEQAQAQQAQQAAGQISNDSAKAQRRPSTNKREGSGNLREASTPGRQLPVRPAPGGARAAPTAQTVPQDKQLDKRVPMLAHLYPSRTSERASIATADQKIHPAVLTLGLQLRDYVICGANARTVATLLVLKKVIQAYSTPSGHALSRHLTSVFNTQIGYLSHARPLSVAQGNSIRWLKKLISALDPDIAENEAKSFLCKAIDQFIREKVTLADEVIAREAGERIEKEGEVILTYGKSSVVEKTLLSAWEDGKRFKVVVVDSRPLFEGRNLARSLIRAGLADVRYCLLSGLGDAIENEGVTKCFLGASAMLGNGRLTSRAGTAMVAMMAKEAGSRGAQGRDKVPVIVLCETIKFTGRVALDSLITNEIADPDILVEREAPRILTDVPAPQTGKQDGNQQKKGSGGNKSSSNNDESEDAKKKQRKGLDGWRDQPNLFLVNLMYDVTPAEYLDMVISELGSLPPSAVPVVNGVYGGDE